jgi:hypothetical protein
VPASGCAAGGPGGTGPAGGGGLRHTRPPPVPPARRDRASRRTTAVPHLELGDRPGQAGESDQNPQLRLGRGLRPRVRQSKGVTEQPDATCPRVPARRLAYRGRGAPGGSEDGVQCGDGVVERAPPGEVEGSPRSGRRRTEPRTDHLAGRQQVTPDAQAGTLAHPLARRKDDLDRGVLGHPEHAESVRGAPAAQNRPGRQHAPVGLDPPHVGDVRAADPVGTPAQALVARPLQHVGWHQPQRLGPGERPDGQFVGRDRRPSHLARLRPIRGPVRQLPRNCGRRDAPRPLWRSRRHSPECDGGGLQPRWAAEGESDVVRVLGANKPGNVSVTAQGEGGRRRGRRATRRRRAAGGRPARGGRGRRQRDGRR